MKLPSLPTKTNISKLSRMILNCGTSQHKVTPSSYAKKMFKVLTRLRK